MRRKSLAKYKIAPSTNSAKAGLNTPEPFVSGTGLSISSGNSVLSSPAERLCTQRTFGHIPKTALSRAKEPDQLKMTVASLAAGPNASTEFPVIMLAYAGKPVIAIINTWSDINPCHSHLRERANDVKRGVWQAGGFPVEMPAITLGETFQKPTTMMYRNLLAMETEELLRSYPADGCVLLGGCDKTTPALLMGAISANLPAIFVPAGPMLRGNWRGQILGSGSDVSKYWAERRAGNIDQQAWMQIEEGIARSAGTCMTMGTASTMAAVTEALGLSLPGASSIPAVDSSHERMAAASGRRIVDLVWQDVRPRDILTRTAFDNAITTLMAIGGSTNALIHIVAMAGRAGITLPLEHFDAISRRTPLLANIRPSGQYLMEA